MNAVRRIALTLVAGLLTLACVAGCSGPAPAANGPLEIGGDPGRLCIPLGKGRDLTYGFDAIRNSGPVPLEVQTVSLVQPHDLRLVEAFLLPIEGRPAIGATAVWPPTNADAVAVWGRRAKAVGAQISKADGNVNLALHLAATSDEASFEAVRVRYRVGNREFVGRTSTRFRVKPSCIPSDRH
jgi:hypothetical protein